MRGNHFDECPGVVMQRMPDLCADVDRDELETRERLVLGKVRRSAR